MKQLGGVAQMFASNEIDSAVEGDYEFIARIAFDLWSKFRRAQLGADVYQIKLTAYEWPEDLEESE